MSESSNNYPNCYEKIPVQQLLLEKGISKSGWMYKKSGRLNKINFTQLSSYDRRFFVLLNGWVYYYKDEKSNEPQKCFSLEGYSNRVHPADEEKILALPHMFKVYHEYTDHRTYFFAPDSREEKQSWIQCFRDDIEKFNYRVVPKSRGSKSLPENQRHFYPSPQNRPSSSFNNPAQKGPRSDSAGNSMPSSHSASTNESIGSFTDEGNYDQVSRDDIDSDEGNYVPLEQDSKGFSPSFPTHQISPTKPFLPKTLTQTQFRHLKPSTPSLSPPFKPPSVDHMKSPVTPSFPPQFKLPSPDSLKPPPPPVSQKPRAPSKEVFHPVFSPPPILPPRPDEIQSDIDDSLYSTIDDEPPKPLMGRLPSFPQNPPPLPPTQSEENYELPNQHPGNFPHNFPSPTEVSPPARPPKPEAMKGFSTSDDDSYIDVSDSHQSGPPPVVYDQTPDHFIDDMLYTDTADCVKPNPNNVPNLTQARPNFSRPNQPRDIMHKFNERKVGNKPTPPTKSTPTQNKNPILPNKPNIPTNINSANRPNTFGNSDGNKHNLKPASVPKFNKNVKTPEQSVNTELANVFNSLGKAKNKPLLPGPKPGANNIDHKTPVSSVNKPQWSKPEPPTPGAKPKNKPILPNTKPGNGNNQTNHNKPITSTNKPAPWTIKEPSTSGANTNFREQLNQQITSPTLPFGVKLKPAVKDKPAVSQKPNTSTKPPMPPAKPYYR